MADKETMAIIKQMVADGQISQEVAEKYFPELKEKESEDEKIRKHLINYFKHKMDDTLEYWEGIAKEDALAWLEKQGEQKSAWSEEDCNQIESIACHLDNIGNGAMAESLLNIMYKYKSYRPQSHWKPSIEQMEALKKECFAHSSYHLCRLLDDLKKL